MPASEIWWIQRRVVTPDIAAAPHRPACLVLGVQTRSRRLTPVVADVGSPPVLTVGSGGRHSQLLLDGFAGPPCHHPRLRRLSLSCHQRCD